MTIYLSLTNKTVGQYNQPILAYHRNTSIDVYVFYMHRCGNFLKRMWYRKRPSKELKMTLITGEVYGFSHLKQWRILPRTTFFFSGSTKHSLHTVHTCCCLLQHHNKPNLTEGCRQQDKRLLNKTVVWEILHQSADNETTLVFHWISALCTSTEG